MTSNKELLEPLSKLSLDSQNKEVMVNSLFEMINFDKVKDQYKSIIHREAQLKSNDALYFFDEDEIFFIERRL